MGSLNWFWWLLIPLLWCVTLYVTYQWGQRNIHRRHVAAAAGKAQNRMATLSTQGKVQTIFFLAAVWQGPAPPVATDEIKPQTAIEEWLLYQGGAEGWKLARYIEGVWQPEEVGDWQPGTLFLCRHFPRGEWLICMLKPSGRIEEINVYESDTEETALVT